MRYFNNKGYKVEGIDISDYGIKKNNKKLIKKCDFGEIDLLLDEKINKKKKYNIIFIGNILEHLLDPEKFFSRINKLSTKKKTFIIVTVPNDFSRLQKELLISYKIKSNYWLVPPEHINYFNNKSIVKFLSSNGWEELVSFADFPIEWFLVNKHSNYKSKKIGKDIFSGIKFLEKVLYKSNKIKDIFNFYKSLANIQMGRNITVIAKRL